MKNSISLYIIFLFFIAGCGGSKKNTDFDKGQLLKNIAYNHVIPSYEASLKSFEKLHVDIVSFQQGDSKIELKDLQNAWIQASLSWAKTAPYRFGPIDELLIENNFYYFPIDTTKVSTALSSFGGDKDYIKGLGSNVQGLGALEYLLFEKEAIHHSDLSFLELLANNLILLNQKVLSAWKEKYAKDFANSTGSEINSGITKLTNQWIEVIDYIKGDEVGRPSGKTMGVEKNIYNLQAPYSKISSELIEAKIVALQQSFNGGNEKGVDDYLNYLDIKVSDNLPLAQKINQQIATILSTLESEESLSSLIENNSKKVDQLYLQALNLSIMLKTDMMSQLGLVTTFSDGDGD